MPDFRESEFTVQRDASWLFEIYRGNNDVVSDRGSAIDRILQEDRTNPTSVKLMMDVNRVFNGAAICASHVIRRERAPSHDLPIDGGDSDGMFRSVLREPG